KVISMQQIRLLIQSLEQGFSLRAIASQLKLSRQTVTHYVEKIKSSCCSYTTLRQMSDAELAVIMYPAAQEADIDKNERRQDLRQRIPYLLAELKRTGVTRLLLWKEYTKGYSDPYGYTQFYILLKRSIEFVTVPKLNGRQFKIIRISLILNNHHEENTIQRDADCLDSKAAPDLLRYKNNRCVFYFSPYRIHG
ncbi:MAG TPA: hypothetical protein PK339_09175, partial [Flavitalea sp.]|nr:hypothetical protein [Flavitalea sp.]